MSSDSESLGDSDDELRAAVALAGPGTFVERATRPSVYDAEGLRSKLKQLENGLDWLERLDLVCSPAPGQPGTETDFDPAEVDANDDFKREILFYRLAQSAAIEGIRRLKEAGVPTGRPDDYLAEMVKSDNHMAKVRSNLVTKQRDHEMREKAKALRQQKKFAKQVQQEAQLKKQQEKRSFNEALKKVKKGQSSSEDLEGLLSGGQKRQAPAEKEKPAKRQKANRKRDYKNQKWGFGGQKKRAKYNTKESAKSFKGFDTKKHGATPKKAKQMRQLTKNKNKRRGRKR